jgi:hypothetical protein
MIRVPPSAFALGFAGLIPFIWGALMSLGNLMTGFGHLLILDFAYQRWGLAPAWWMTLRASLIAVVLICLAIGVWA